MTTSKRELNIISGIEENESRRKRIRSYLSTHFSEDPKSFFLEWPTRSMIIMDGCKWRYPERSEKLALFLDVTYIKKKKPVQKKAADPVITCLEVIEQNTKPQESTLFDFGIDDEAAPTEDNVSKTLNKLFTKNSIKSVSLVLEQQIQSPYHYLTNFSYKKYKSNKRNNKLFLLLTIHNYDITESLSQEHSNEIFKIFSKDKAKVSDDVRLFNVLCFVNRSNKRDEKKYSLKFQSLFMNEHIGKRVIPTSQHYISQIQQ